MIHRISGTAFILTLLTSSAMAQDATDPRARDAVLLFSNLCGNIVAKLEPPPDDGRYRIGQVDAKTAAEVIPGLNGAALWSVVAPASDTHMLHYTTKGGICGVEVAEADREAIDRLFRTYVGDVAARWSVDATLREDEVKDGFRNRIWRLRGPDGDIDIGLDTLPGKEPQHILIMARAKAEADPSQLPAGPTDGQ
jgi:hypothetical protein